MNARKYFWGSIVILVGALLLLNNFNLLSFNINWHALGSMWPLILIIIGLNSLSKNTSWNPWIFTGLNVVVLTVLIYQVISFEGKPQIGDGTWSNGEEQHSNSNTQSFSLPVDSNLKRVQLNFEGAAAQFYLQDTSNNLIVAEANTTGGEYSLTKVNIDTLDKISLKLQKTKFHYKDGEWNNTVKMKLNTLPVWSMNMEVGAGALEFDLSPYKVEKINLDAGAAAIQLKLGSLYPNTKVDIDAGASSIEIMIPKDARCKMELDAVLSSKSMEGFTEMAEHIYQTENYNDTTKPLIHIVLDAGMSDVTVRRY